MLCLRYLLSPLLLHLVHLEIHVYTVWTHSRETVYVPAAKVLYTTHAYLEPDMETGDNPIYKAVWHACNSVGAV